MEGHIEGIITESGCTSEQFFNTLKADFDSDGESAIYVEIILAAAEFENFVEMMRSYKRQVATDTEVAQI